MLLKGAPAAPTSQWLLQLTSVSCAGCQKRHTGWPLQSTRSNHNNRPSIVIGNCLCQVKCSHVILGRLQPLLRRQQRPQQSGFTSGRSTADAILALRLLSELHREFSKPLHVAYVDIKAAFDSVDRDALWKALQAKHAPPFLIRLIKDLHTGTKSCVRVGGSWWLCSCTSPILHRHRLDHVHVCRQGRC